MAIIDEQTLFDADKLTACVIGIAADIGKHDSGMHQHKKGQLLYAPQGCMSFVLNDLLCILPPTKAVWIPPYTQHRVMMTNVVAYRSLYFDCDMFDCPTTMTMVEVDTLLKALIDKWHCGHGTNQKMKCKIRRLCFGKSFMRLNVIRSNCLCRQIDDFKNSEHN